MKCPLCNTEMQIKDSGYVSNEGRIYLRQILTCRNKNCSNFGKNVKTIYTPVAISEDSEAQ